MSEMEGGEEGINFYQHKLGYDLVANTAGIDISGDVDEHRLHAPIGPPPRVVKEKTEGGE